MLMSTTRAENYTSQAHCRNKAPQTTFRPFFWPCGHTVFPIMMLRIIPTVHPSIKDNRSDQFKHGAGNPSVSKQLLRGHPKQTKQPTNKRTGQKILPTQRESLSLCSCFVNSKAGYANINIQQHGVAATVELLVLQLEKRNNKTTGA